MLPRGVVMQTEEREQQVAKALAEGALKAAEAGLVGLVEQLAPGRRRLARRRDLALIKLWLGEVGEARAILTADREEALAVGQAEGLGDCLAALGEVSLAWVQATEGDPAGALQRVQAAAGVLFEAGHMGVVEAAGVRGFVGKLARGPEVAVFEGIEELPEDLRGSLADWCLAASERADAGLGVNVLVELHQRLSHLGPAAALPALGERIAELAYQAGDLATAAGAFAWVAEAALDEGDPELEVRARAGQTAVLQAAGEGEKGLSLLRELVDSAHGGPYESAALQALGEAFARAGRWENAALAEEAARARFRERGDVAGEAMAELALAMVSLRRGGSPAERANRAMEHVDPRYQALCLALQQGRTSATDRLQAVLPNLCPPGLITEVSEQDGDWELSFGWSPGPIEALRVRLLVEKWG